MYVNEITDKIEMLDELPYNCVFFNGAWGIGKSYAADQVKDKETIIRVSLSGIKSADEVYAEILDAYVGQKGFTNVVGKVASTAVKVAANFDQTKIASGVASDIAGSFLSSKSALRIYYKRQKKTRIVILDDFERVWDGIDITEVFRVVEFLTNQKIVKVSMIGDLTKLPGNIADKFKKYSERYIDRIYEVTDISNSIDWEAEPLEIDAKFITEFKALHNFHNLRSVIKANNFYKDVQLILLSRSNVIKKDSVQFWNDLRLTVFALIIESIDEIKLSEIKLCDSTSSEQQIVLEMSKKLESRVGKYLQDSRFGTFLYKPLLEYYETNSINVELFESIYNQTLQDERPPYFYSDEKNIRSELPSIRESIMTIDNLSELIKTMRDYTQLCSLCGEDGEEAIPDFKKRLHELVVTLVNQDVTDIFETGYFDFVLENRKLLEIVNEEFANARKLMVDHWIGRLLKGEFTEKEFNLAKKLSDYCHSDTYKTLIEQHYSDLLCHNIFPINAHNDIQYYTSVTILRMLNRIDGERLEKFYNELKLEDMDSVARNRCKQAMAHLND